MFAIPSCCQPPVARGSKRPAVGVPAFQGLRAHQLSYVHGACCCQSTSPLGPMTSPLRPARPKHFQNAARRSPIIKNPCEPMFSYTYARPQGGTGAFSNPRMSLKSVRAEKGRLQGEDLLSERIEGFERGGGQGGGGSCAHSCRDHEGFLELPLPPPLNVESGAVRPR